MTTFPGSPRLLRGAIVALDPANPLANVIAFQYNPETLSRSLSPKTSGAGLSKVDRSRLSPAEVNRIAGPPQESISLTIEIDATDKLEQADAIATGLGIHPQLAALEMLLYPKSLTVIRNSILSKAGVLEIAPTESPLTLFIWGKNRILPVQLDSMSIEELAYDVNLNPIRADVSLSMQVLNYSSLKFASMGSALFLAHQVQKEGMATLDSVKNISSLAKSIKGAIPLI